MISDLTRALMLQLGAAVSARCLPWQVEAIVQGSVLLLVKLDGDQPGYAECEVAFTATGLQYRWPWNRSDSSQRHSYHGLDLTQVADTVQRMLATDLHLNQQIDAERE
jgi:hypothetical protein